jgi:hypothetical protein
METRLEQKDESRMVPVTRGRGVLIALLVLIIVLIVAVIVLAVELAKYVNANNGGGGGGPAVPNPATPVVQGFTVHQEDPTWQCPTRYRCKFAGNSHWSHPSAWTPFVSSSSGKDSPAPNWAPLLVVSNAGGQSVTWQRQVGPPQHNNVARSDDGVTQWLDVTLGAPMGDETGTYFVDGTEPCGSGNRLEAPVQEGWYTPPENATRHVWCPTSYSVAYTTSANKWSQWSAFTENPEREDPTAGFPVLKVDTTSPQLIFRRRTDPLDNIGQVMQLTVFTATRSDTPTQGLWLDEHVPNCVLPAPRR